MTKRDLIEQLAAYPDDTVLLAFDRDDMATAPVTGLLYVPPYASLDEHDQRKSYTPPTLEFRTDAVLKRTSPGILALIPDSRDMRRKLKLGKFTPPLGGKKSIVSYAGKKFGSD